MKVILKIWINCFYITIIQRIVFHILGSARNILNFRNSY